MVSQRKNDVSLKCQVSHFNHTKDNKKINIFMLVKNRKEFTDLALEYLFKFTDFKLVNKFVIVDDCSNDETIEVCRSWIRKADIGEIVNIKGGSVTNALYFGSEPYLHDQVKYMVKLDNDMIVSENWLNILYTQAEKNYNCYDIFGFTMVNEFFKSTFNEIWSIKPPNEYSLKPVPYTGGNFLMKWEVFKRYRNIGVIKNPSHYICGSLSEVHKLLEEKNFVKIAIVNPHLPVFKLDKVADREYDEYKFFDKRQIDKKMIKRLIEQYYHEGLCRKRLIGGRIINDHTNTKNTLIGILKDSTRKNKLSSTEEISIERDNKVEPDNKAEKIICISGMHRSGSSMITKLLIECGLYTGPKHKLIPPQPDNPMGFWENIDFVSLNDAILFRLGGGWDFFPIHIKPGWEKNHLFDKLKIKARELVELFKNYNICGWKDPRSSLTINFWENIFPELRVVMCLRNPLDVSLSLQKRNNNSIPFGLNLWEIYNRQLISNINPERIVITHYDSYFIDPIKEVKRITDKLGIRIPQDTIKKACSTISTTLRHAHHSRQDLISFGVPTKCIELYDYLCDKAGPLARKEKMVKTVIHESEIQKTQITSIIILAHNQLEFTEKCIESILRYTDCPFELIIVDNGSSDGTKQYLKEISIPYINEWSIEEINEKYKNGESDEITQRSNKNCRRFKIFFNTQNKGFAEGNNQGIEDAHGDYVLLMNNDVVVTPNWLERLIACMKNHPNSGIIGPRTNYVSGPQLVDKVEYNTVTLEGLNAFSKHFALTNSRKSSRILRVVGFCMLIKKEVIDKIGGLDPRYGIGNFEDDDFSLRAALAGYESWVAEDCFIHHYGSKTFLGAKIDFKKSLEKNWEIFKKKWRLPADMPYGSTYSFLKMNVTGFDPKIHYIPLQIKGGDPLKEQLENMSAVEREYSTVCSRLDKKDLEIAIEILQGFANKYQNFAMVYNDLGVFYYQKGYNESALRYYRIALNLDRNNISFRKNLADLLAVTFGEYEEALKHYVAVLASHPKDVEALLATGHICGRLERYDDAAEFYEKVIEIEPNNSEAANWLANMRERRSGNSLEKSLNDRYLTFLSEIDHEDLAGAIQKIENFIEVYPYYGQAHNDLGILYYKNESKNKVIARYLKAVELEPDNVTFRKNLADFLYVDEGRVEEALENYVAVLRIKPDDTETLLITGHICTEIERFEDAMNFYHKVLYIEPQNLDARQNLEALEKRQVSMFNQEANNETDPGEKTEIIQSEPLAPNDDVPIIQAPVVEDFINKADSLFQQERIDQAVDILLKAIAVNPLDGRTYIKLAEQLLNHGRNENALEVLLEVPEKQPEALVNKKFLLEGYCQEGIGSYAAAKKCCDWVLECEPESAKVLNLLGILAYRNGDKETAEQHFKRAIELNPEYGEPHTNLGSIVWEKGPPKMALEHYERGFTISPTDIDVANAYHEAVTATGAYDRAEKVARDALKRYPQCRKVHYLLIDTLMRQEKTVDALKELEAALSTFGIDEGLLDTALALRNRVGKTKKNGSAKKPGVSLCMIVKDEEANLARCLASVKPIVDEMVVVDTGSNDRTKDIAEFFGAHVYDFEWNGDFAAARNFSLSKARGHWIFILDADEVISSKDYGRFRKLINIKTVGSAAYSIVTRNYCLKANTIGWNPNDGHYAHEEAGIGWLPSEKVRLFSNNNDIKFEGAVHEMVDPVLKRLSIKIKKCAIPVHHFGRLNVDKMDGKGQFYYEIGRKKLAENGGNIGAVRELAIQATILEKNLEALELWQKFIEMEPGDLASSEAHVNMGTVYLRLKDYSNALLSAKEAAKLGPDMKEAKFNLAMMELYHGNARAAVSVLDSLGNLILDYPPAQFILTASRCCLGETGDGLNQMRKLKKSQFAPMLLNSCAELAEGLLTAGQSLLAFNLLKTSIESEIVNKNILDLYAESLKQTKTINNFQGDEKGVRNPNETIAACN